MNDPRLAATGWATEREGDGSVNAVACLENTEVAFRAALTAEERLAKHQMPKPLGTKIDPA